MPGMAKPSRPSQGTPTKEGGNKVGVSNGEENGPFGPLGKWLLPCSSRTEQPGAKDVGEGEGKGKLQEGRDGDEEERQEE